MRRRDFLALVGGATALRPLVGGAQQKAMPVIGLLSAFAPPPKGRAASVVYWLKDTGYTEGVNLAVEYRFVDGDYDRLPADARDLVERGVTLIMAQAIPAALAAKAATSTIPIVFAVGVDPVEFGLVKSLNQPGGNATGVMFLHSDLQEKSLEFLHELVPSASSMGYLSNENNANAASQWKYAEATARVLGLAVTKLSASNDNEIERAFQSARAKGLGAILIGSDPYLDRSVERLVGVATAYAVPTMYFRREYAAAGGLISFGPSYSAMNRLEGTYVERILNGAKPAELPVQQPTKFELVINLKTAKALGLTIPQSLLARADEVIE